MSDIVGDIITRLAIECPELTVDAIYRVESAIRREYGGDKVCIHAVDRELRRESALRAVNAGITLADAERMLQAYLSAEVAVLAGQTVEMAGPGGSRRLTMANLAEIQRGIDIWDKRVKDLAATTAGNKRSINVTPRW
jgi:hypothetical protein